jgi:hypothetical protein
VPASTPPDVSIAPGSSPAGGYLPLRLFGIPPVGGVTDDSITNFNVPAFTYAGETYTRVGFSSNGYVVVGGGTAADNSITTRTSRTRTGRTTCSRCSGPTTRLRPARCASAR